jgi:glycosyltransferase involved in cell wall biosynthesis
LNDLVKLFREIGKEGKFLVHTHSSKAGILGRLAARLAGANRIIHSIHGFGHSHHPNTLVRKVLWGAEKVASYCTDGFTGDSSANLVQGKEQSLIGKIPHGVVYCGVDTEEFKSLDPDDSQLQSLREELSIPREHHIILNISCLKPQKDPITYVEVAQRVLQEHPNTTFLLAGDGELRGELESTIENMGIQSSVRLLGWRRDIPGLLALSDLMVLTSLWEGLPQSFGQAMATGTPIVATRVDGAPEAIVEGVNGLLYDTKDVDGLSSGISRLLGDEKTRREMGERARESASRFSQETMLDTLDSFYASIL